MYGRRRGGSYVPSISGMHEAASCLLDALFRLTTYGVIIHLYHGTADRQPTSISKLLSSVISDDKNP